jgi:hypothetical protein
MLAMCQHVFMPDQLNQEPHPLPHVTHPATLVYVQVSRAKAVLGLGACAGGIPLCRDKEVRLIDGILQKNLREGTGTSLYVSGLPGTGMEPGGFRVPATSWG